MIPAKEKNVFKFKQFSVRQDQCLMKVGMDGVLLGAWADVTAARRILDIGCGTGLIAIMMAQRNEEARVDAVEIDEGTCAQATENLASSPFANRLQTHQQSIQDFAREQDKPYDLIICNPPFFTGGALSAQAGRNSVRHTIKLPHNELLIAVRKLLNKQGKFAVILPLIEGLRFKELACQYHLYCTRQTEVRPTPEKGIERLLMQFEYEEKPTQQSELLIASDGNRTYTKEYQDLTGDFYLNF